MTKNFLSGCKAFIIPNEFPTILSVIYSNIPPVKVGKFQNSQI